MSARGGAGRPPRRKRSPTEPERCSGFSPDDEPSTSAVVITRWRPSWRARSFRRRQRHEQRYAPIHSDRATARPRGFPAQAAAVQAPRLRLRSCFLYPPATFPEHPETAPTETRPCRWPPLSTDPQESRPPSRGPRARPGGRPVAEAIVAWRSTDRLFTPRRGPCVQRAGWGSENWRPRRRACMGSGSAVRLHDPLGDWSSPSRSGLRVPPPWRAAGTRTELQRDEDHGQHGEQPPHGRRRRPRSFFWPRPLASYLGTGIALSAHIPERGVHEGSKRFQRREAPEYPMDGPLIANGVRSRPST